MVDLNESNCSELSVCVCVCVFGGYKETKNKIKIRVQ